MLPLALDALLDVLEARFETTRVEKERAAILSEAAMVNTIDYRVEVQLLAALHAENRLHRRFPIGQACILLRTILTLSCYVSVSPLDRSSR